MNIKMKSLTIKKCFVLLLLILSSNISVAQDCLDSESYYQYRIKILIIPVIMSFLCSIRF